MRFVAAIAAATIAALPATLAARAGIDLTGNDAYGKPYGRVKIVNNCVDDFYVTSVAAYGTTWTGDREGPDDEQPATVKGNGGNYDAPYRAFYTTTCPEIEGNPGTWCGPSLKIQNVNGGKILQYEYSVTSHNHPEAERDLLSYDISLVDCATQNTGSDWKWSDCPGYYKNSQVTQSTNRAGVFGGIEIANDRCGSFFCKGGTDCQKTAYKDPVPGAAQNQQAGLVEGFQPVGSCARGFESDLTFTLCPTNMATRAMTFTA